MNAEQTNADTERQVLLLAHETLTGHANFVIDDATGSARCKSCDAAWLLTREGWVPRREYEAKRRAWVESHPEHIAASERWFAALRRRLDVDALSRKMDREMLFEANRNALRELERVIETASVADPRPLHKVNSAMGILRDLGPAPSDDVIDDMRHELWSEFSAVAGSKLS